MMVSDQMHNRMGNRNVHDNSTLADAENIITQYGTSHIHRI